MPHYKDSQSRVYFLSDEDISRGGASYLPAGCVEISDAEADTLRNPPATLDDLKAAKLKDINQKAQEVADQLTAGYPEFEKSTWPDQQAEALAWDADNTVATPCLDTLAGYRGIDRAVYIGKTLAKVQAYRAAGWYLAGTRQKYEDALKLANTPAKVAAIVPVYTLPS